MGPLSQVQSRAPVGILSSLVRALWDKGWCFSQEHYPGEWSPHLATCSPQNGDGQCAELIFESGITKNSAEDKRKQCCSQSW